MEGSTSLKLIMEKGPREGEALKFPSGSIIKIGRVVRGNTIAIKDAGISSKHVCIQFDIQLSKWTLCDLDSSNGTSLNGQILKPYVPSVLADGDRIKIGELTSIIVKNEVESSIRPKRNPRRQGKHEAGAGVESAAIVESGKTELGLGFDGDLDKIEVKEPIKKWNLRSGANKDLDLRNDVERLSSRRILRSSKKEEVSFIPVLNQIPQNLNVDVRDLTDLLVPKPHMPQGRKKKTAYQLPVNPDLDKHDIAVQVVGKRIRGRRKGLPEEPLENAPLVHLEENLNNAKESLQADEGNEVALDKSSVDPLKNLDTNNESAQEHMVEKFVSIQECCEGKDAMGEQSSSKGKEVEKDSNSTNNGSDEGQWLDLEKMTLGDFFDYLEVQLPKEIYDESEKIISNLAEKARKCYEFRVQRNEHGTGIVKD
ncbi:hypothetical protein E3N88_24131 [Mikania micrantha]|uniref:FHA domain-containing protein n=1 Tax=Mikania micrantha TaxID=192012 RepID=A0A5N6NGW3_9ASTR|nr:hypothetical protein E3N88_24131 [Mikania micrantha]